MENKRKKRLVLVPQKTHRCTLSVQLILFPDFLYSKQKVPDS